MKPVPRLLLFLLLAARVAGVGAGIPQNGVVAPEGEGRPPLRGKVLEVIDVPQYTYLRLRVGKGEVWAAVGKAAVKRGQDVTVLDPLVMSNFESKTLQRRFDRIVFGRLEGYPALGPHADGRGPAAEPEIAVLNVPKAEGPTGRTIAEVHAHAKQLAGQSVAVRGAVVRALPNVKGRTWLHLRDGSGSAQGGSNDLVVTTRSAARVGDIVVARGVLRIGVASGMGYTYPVLVEDATLQK